MGSLDKLKQRLKAYSAKHGRPYNQALQALLLERAMVRLAQEPKLQVVDAIIHDAAISWAVYPPETIFSEKIHSMVANGDRNSRSKDVYDLAHYTTIVNTAVLKTAILNTFSFRQMPVPDSIAETLANLETSVLRLG